MALELMKCGNCGGAEAYLRATKAERYDGFSQIEITCAKCQSVTVLTIAKPYIEAHRGENGAFCIGWKE